MFWAHIHGNHLKMLTKAKSKNRDLILFMTTSEKLTVKTVLKPQSIHCARLRSENEYLILS